MAAEALTRYDDEVIQVTAAAARASGEILQLCDGRAGVVQQLNAVASGDAMGVKVRGVVEVLKTASIVMLAGGRAFWDRSANKANYLAASGDFYLGVVVEDAAAADTTVKVALNEKQANLLDFDGAISDVLWTTTETLGLGVIEANYTTPTKLEFDAVAEAATAALYPTEARFHAPVADGPILEMELAIYDIGDDAALDINAGLANESHATDADSITESFFVHLDGTALSILGESDDGTTEVAAADTTVDAVDDTFFEVWWDCRNLADCKLYIDGVRVLSGSTFVLSAATGPLFPLIHVEKTSNDTTADVRVRAIRLRTTDLV